MARAVSLKVYRTPIGFHDAYVAASSQKAALKAWGSAHDLFGTGEAELVTDPALTEEPLAKPGTIVRRVRGTTAEHIAALPAEPVAPDSAPAPRPVPRHKPAKSPKPAPKAMPARPPKPRPPKPEPTAVNAAKAELDAASNRHAAALEDLKLREEALKQERQALERSHREVASSLRTALGAADASYTKAVAAWKADAAKRS